MIISFPEDCAEIIDAIRSGIGREVLFVTEQKETCSGCGINPITNSSTNPFCLTCSGLGYIITYSGTAVLAHITHGKLDERNWVTGGEIDDGSVRIQIKYTLENLGLAENSNYVYIDNERYKINKVIKRGFKEINRIILDLSQEDEEVYETTGYKFRCN